jgi:hypothetical protein
MRSDIVHIDNSGAGFQRVTDEAKKVATYKGLGEMDAIQLQVLTEELLSLAHSIAGKVKASFWIEFENAQADLHLTTKAVLDKEKRAELIASSTSQKNEAARTFLGWLRDQFQEAMASDADHYQPSDDIMNDLPLGVYDNPDYDGFERSILKKLADDIKIGINGENVDITVSKRFSTPN